MQRRKRLQGWKARRNKNARATGDMKKTAKSWLEYLGVETREQMSIIEELQLQPWMKDIDWEHYPAESKRDGFNAWLYKKMGGQKNIPDFRFHERRGTYNGFWFEYKKTGTKLFKVDGSPYADIKPQWDYLLRMEKKLGIKIAVIESPEKAIQAIKEYLQLL